MIEFLSVFAWTIAGSLIMGLCLVWGGAHLAARHQGLQALVATQSAAVGVLLALALMTQLGVEHAHFAPETLIGFALALGVYLFSERYLLKRSHRRSVFYIAIYTVMIAASYLLIAASSHIEAHSHMSFFGDVAFSSNFDSKAMLAVGIIGLALIFRFRRPLLLGSFFWALSGPDLLKLRWRRLNIAFQILAILFITLSVKAFGTLFTLSCLFIPTVVLSGGRGSFKSFEWKLLIAGAVGIVSGYVLSYLAPSLPTSACLTLTLLGTSFVAGLKA